MCFILQVILVGTVKTFITTPSRESFDPRPLLLPSHLHRLGCPWCCRDPNVRRAVGGPRSGGYEKLVKEFGKLNTYRGEEKRLGRGIPQICSADNSHSIRHHSESLHHSTRLSSVNFRRSLDVYTKSISADLLIQCR
jgi:hypothetical protein